MIQPGPARNPQSEPGFTESGVGIARQDLRLENTGTPRHS